MTIVASGEALPSEQIRQLEASDQPDGKLDDNLELDNLELNQNPCGEKGGIVPAGLRGLTLEVVPEASEVVGWDSGLDPCGEKGGIVHAGLRGLTLEVVPEASPAPRISVWRLRDPLWDNSSGAQEFLWRH